MGSGTSLTPASASHARWRSASEAISAASGGVVRSRADSSLTGSPEEIPFVALRTAPTDP